MFRISAVLGGLRFGSLGATLAFGAVQQRGAPLLPAPHSRTHGAAAGPQVRRRFWFC